MTKYIGIDYGKKRVGIALSDDDGNIAFSKEILENDTNLLENIKKLCEEEGVGGVVVGESLTYNREPNEIMAEINSFKEGLAGMISIPISTEQEFMTSLEARRMKKFFEEIPGRRQKKERVAIDAEAAALILQRFLDKEKKRK